MNQKGISTVISTVLILALVMVITVIVWATISNLVKDNTEEISLGRIETSLNILKVYAEGDNLIVNVERGKGKGDLTGVKFIIRSEDKEEIIEKEIELREFDSEKFSLTLTKFKPLDVIKVSVAPLLESGTSEVKDVWELKRDMSCTPTTNCESESFECGEIEDDCGNVLDCGTCSDGMECTLEGICECPQTCEIGNCGEHTFCGEIIDCGNCESGQFCYNGNCINNLRMYVTSVAFAGNNLGGLTGADFKCNSSSYGKPAGTRTWKALIGTSIRQANTIPILADWVLKPNVKYYRGDNTLIGSTGDSGWLIIPLNHSVSTMSGNYWTGINSLGALTTGHNCDNWTTTVGFSYTGNPTLTNNGAIIVTSLACPNPARLLCVEQP